VLIGTVGGAITVACYTAIGFATHRRNDGWSRVVDYLVLVPRAVPGLLIGLAFLWVFLFFPPLAPLRKTIFSMWIAYTVVWLAYGMRLISSSLLQVSTELEEAARTVGASRGRISREITLPLIRHGLLGSWLLVFMIFEREYSTGVYLLAPGTEVIGAPARLAVAGRAHRRRRCAVADQHRAGLHRPRVCIALRCQASRLGAIPWQS
jgi:iron(III) transport system permease protein